MSFARMFAKIGKTFGAGDGEATFCLLDYRGVFLHWLGWHSAMDFATTQDDAIRNLTDASVGRFVGNDTGIDGMIQTIGSTNGSVAGDSGALVNKYFDFDASRVMPIAGKNRPINKAINYFIKY